MTREEMIAAAQRMRRPRNNILQGLRDLDAVTVCEELHIEVETGVSHLYVVRPAGQEGPLPVFLNLHGGGFTNTHGERDILFCRQIVYMTNCVAVSLDYRLAPEYPYPAALDEEEAVLRYLVRNAQALNIRPDKIAVVGQSSGANNATVLAMRLKNDPEVKLCCQICAYPVTDVATDSSEKTKDVDPRRLEISRMYNAFYVPEQVSRSNPEISPLYAGPELLRGMPRAILMPAAQDELCAECEAYGEHLKAAGVPVEVYRFEHSRHGFLINQNGEWRKGRAFVAYQLLKAFDAES